MGPRAAAARAARVARDGKAAHGVFESYGTAATVTSAMQGAWGGYGAYVDTLYRARHTAMGRMAQECVALGYGLSEASFERGISVVTAPVRDHSGGIVAAVAATVPRSDIGADDEKSRLVETICGAAVELSMRHPQLPHNRPQDNAPASFGSSTSRPLSPAEGCRISGAPSEAHQNPDRRGGRTSASSRGVSEYMPAPL